MPGLWALKLGATMVFIEEALAYAPGSFDREMTLAAAAVFGWVPAASNLATIRDG